MVPIARWCATALSVVGSLTLLTHCGGGDDPVIPPSANQAPVLTVVTPAADSRYRAGGTITVDANATDREDGPLAAAQLSWWIDLHHNGNSQTVSPVTPGSSGRFVVPVRGQTSADVWYRVHVRATDSTGRSTEVTRDVQPLTAQVTLTTNPAGLPLMLDGQPVTTPYTFTGVQGIERDLAAASQVIDGRRYAFVNWSDGGTAAHTLTTPAADTVYTATFNDQGSSTNIPPTVALVAPGSAVVGTPVTLAAQASDANGEVTQVAFYDGTP